MDLKKTKETPVIHAKNLTLSPELNSLILKTSKKLSIPSTSIIRNAILFYCRSELGLDGGISFSNPEKKIEDVLNKIIQKYKIGEANEM
jgi:hypothetical protein